jgi:putative aldouronate transport system permease protein
VRSSLYKKSIQTLTYIPHFISLVVICGIIVDFVKQDGIITLVIASLGGSDTNLLTRPELFRAIYVGSEIWQQIGWSSIVFLAALTMVDAELYEAAMIDGASRWRRAWHITLPSIMPTIMVLLILRIGRILNVGFEKIILLYNPTIYETADVISTFVYRKGILNASYSYASAVGLFNSTISCALVVMANKISKKLTDTSLW